MKCSSNRKIRNINSENFVSTLSLVCAIVDTLDLVVLEAGLDPEVDLQETLGIPLGEDGFFKEAHPQLAKNETPIEGILLAGAVQEPVNIAEATVQASAAAMKAPILMQK